jgi:hypothetical protein
VTGTTPYHPKWLEALIHARHLSNEEKGALKFIAQTLRLRDFFCWHLDADQPIAYVKDQMGHSSIQITVDTYGHLIPGANINWVDGLDRKTTPQQNATPAQLETEETEEVDGWSSELWLRGESWWAR